MVTIRQALDMFLEDQKARLRAGTHSRYCYVVDVLVVYLNGYAHQWLDSEAATRHRRLRADHDRRFVEMFGPEVINADMVSDFLGDFLVRKVTGERTFLRSFCTVTRRLVTWLHERGHMDGEERKSAMATIAVLWGDLPAAVELADILAEYVDGAPRHAPSWTVASCFRVTRVESGRLWLRDLMGARRSVGPVRVSRDVSSRCKAGWTLSLELGRTEKGWRILDSGNVYPT